MRVGFTLAQLQYFCGVAELGSFTAAAAAQRVSSNSVSSAINALEESLGTQLCVRRRSRGVELTASGQALYAQAKELLSRADEIFVSIAGSEDGQLDSLTLGCAPPLASTILTRLADAFARRHPRTTLGLAIDDQEDLIERLRSGSLDAAVLYDMGLPPDLERRELYKRTAHVILARRHRLAGRKSVNLRELASDPLILLDAPPMRDSMLRLLREFGVTPDIRYRVTDHEIAKSLVLRNLGYTMAILDTTVDRSALGKGLVYVPIAPKPAEEAIVIAWSPTHTSTDYLSELVALATQHAARPEGRGL